MEDQYWSVHMLLEATGVPLLFAFRLKPRKARYTMAWHVGTTHDDYLVVSIIVQNLVEIDAVVLII